MDTYLQIAETVLRAVRRPLTSKAILKAARQADLLPYRLYGATQHKTLQARLSTDILSYRDRSKFFRNAPGKFFLREFLEDKTIPPEFRKESFARRRTRDLIRGPILVTKIDTLKLKFQDRKAIDADDFMQLDAPNSMFYHHDPRKRSDDIAAIWVFSIVRRGDYLLSFRCGNYRDFRRNFSQKRSVGFSSVVSEQYRNLFNFTEFGISDCGVSVVSADLNIAIRERPELEAQFPHEIKVFMASEDRGRPCAVAVLEVCAPDWFEPINPSLSINDVTWIRSDVRPNNLDDFDPWSQTFFEECLTSKVRDAALKKNDHISLS